MSSGLLDLPHVGWRVSWVVKSELDGINPPHNGGLFFGLSPWSDNSNGEDQWESEDVYDVEYESEAIDNESYETLSLNFDSIPEVNPEHSENRVLLFSLPVVVRGRLSDAVVKSSSIKIFPISVVHSISGDSNE